MNTCYWRTLRPRILNYSEPVLKKEKNATVSLAPAEGC